MMGVSDRLTCPSSPPRFPSRPLTSTQALACISPIVAMSDIEELSTEERVAVVSKYILQAPPGEINDVVAGELAPPSPSSGPSRSLTAAHPALWSS